jgi:DNA (cytosine-5)-methyltransferase 1
VSRAYYNEIDPYAAQWLRNLITAGHIAPGDVDERSIEDVSPDDLRGYTQCHFFAGVGGWSYAMRLAGWPDSRPVWTGSCPCQPFSAAGKGGGFADERHLWPAFHHLIAERRPPVVFGEQVATALGWFDVVAADLEAKTYAVGAFVLPAYVVGAPHERERIFFVAEPCDERCDGGQTRGERHLVDRAQAGWDENTDRPDTGGPLAPWRDGEWHTGGDGRKRLCEPGTFPLAHGATARVGRLRAYGNAIVPQVAAEVINAYMWTHAEAVMAEMT